MSADFFQQLELPSSIARTAKNESAPFTMLDNRLVHADPRLAGLKRGDKEIHIVLLSLPDDWNFKHVGSWLVNKFGFSRSTAFRIIGRLCDAGLMARTWDYYGRLEGYQVFEVPCENRPTGKDARKRHVVMTRKARLPGYHASPSMPRKHYGFLEVTDAGPAFLAPERGVSKLRHIQRTKEDILKTEYPNSPKPPEGGQEFKDESRVKYSTDHPAKPGKTTRRAKRRKGRTSPGRPHNARAKVQRFTRDQINLANFRVEADAEDFMRNLTVRLEPALAELRSLPPARSQAWLDVLRQNPLMAVAQDVYSIGGSWTAPQIRSVLKSLGDRLPVEDLLLFWLGDRSVWQGDTPSDMRHRLGRKKPTSPDIHRPAAAPEWVQQIYTWQSNIDDSRSHLIGRAMAPVLDLVEGIDFDDPASIQEHPMVWTAILASPLLPDSCELLPEMIELARATLVPVSREDIVEWVDAASARMPCRWWGGWCADGDVECIVGRGISAAIGEDLPMGLVHMSGRSHNAYKALASAYSANTHFLD